MGITIFLLLIIISLGLIYIVHKYFGKHEFYLLTCIYCILSFMFSFKLVDIFGLSINLGIIFTSGILTLLYYFINRYARDEIKKFILTCIISTFLCEIIVIINSLMIPSIYDETISLTRNFLSNNLAIFLLYPVTIVLLMALSNYLFRKLRRAENNELFRSIVCFLGLVFANTFIFIFFSYAIIINPLDALLITIDNYFVEVIIVIIFYFTTSKIMKLKKVKS